MTAPERQTLDLGSLSIEQLRSLSRQIRQDVENLSGSVEQMEVALSKFNESQNAVRNLSRNTNKELLVPLSNSIYIKGRMKARDEVKVEVGTGFFVTKTPKEANEHFNKKIAMVEASLDKMQRDIMAKRNSLESVQGVLSLKIREQTQAV